MRTMLRLAIMISAAGIVTSATAGGPTRRDKQQAACYDDVMRLCGQYVPDEQQVVACMKPKKALVSAKCRALWDDQ